MNSRISEAPIHGRDVYCVFCMQFPRSHLSKMRQHSPVLHHLSPKSVTVRIRDPFVHSRCIKRTPTVQHCGRGLPACSNSATSSSIAPRLENLSSRQQQLSPRLQQHSQWRCQSRHAWHPLDRRKATVTHCLSEASGPFASSSSSQHDEGLSPPKASAGLRQVKSIARGSIARTPLLLCVPTSAEQFSCVIAMRSHCFRCPGRPAR